MGEYWGAIADPNYGYSPYSGQQRYASHPAWQTPFTSPPGPGNPLTPETVVAKIRNMHPEQMAALADQWQNAWTFLAEVRHFVVQQSTVLQDEHWRSPQARDAFLRRGPGAALTYLDVWMDALQHNVTALRHLVLVSLEARREADQLMQRYEQELREARAIGFPESLGAFLTRGQSWDAAAREEVAEDVAEVTERYRRAAQALAVKYGDQYFDYIAVVANGVGPPVQPVNGALSAPVVPGVPGPGVVTSPVASKPGGFAPPDATQPPGALPPGALPPGVAPPGMMPPGVVPPGVRPPGTLPPGGSLPPGAGLPPGKLPPPELPPDTVPPGALPPGVLPPGSPPPGALPPGVPGQNGGSLTPPGTVQPPLPGQFGRGGPSGGGATLPPPSSAPPPGRSVRRPVGPPGGAPVTPPGGKEIRRPGTGTGQPLPPPLRRRPEDRAGGRAPGTRTTGDGSSARTYPPSALPVLKNPAENREWRPGSKQELGSSVAEGRPAAQGAAPPVLGRSAPATPPNRSRPAPATPPNRNPPSTAAPSVLGRPAPVVPPPRPARRDRGALAWLDLFGVGKARSGAGGASVEPPQRSRPESGPRALRSRAAEPQPAARQRTVPPELTKRRQRGEPATERADGDIVTDEQAFGVRSPGGGVVKRD